MLRALWKRRGFAAVVIATLTLGLGATIGIFSIANAVLLRPLPYPNADRIVVLRTLAEDGTPTARVAPRDMEALYVDHPSLAAAALAFYAEGRITGNDAVDYNMGRYGVTDQFFDVFNVPMAKGRGFTRGEPQGPVVISYATWRDVFASDPDIIGKSIRVENGVRPVKPGFRHLSEIDHEVLGKNGAVENPADGGQIAEGTSEKRSVRQNADRVGCPFVRHRYRHGIGIAAQRPFRR